jgi:hypothetical protein
MPLCAACKRTIKNEVAIPMEDIDDNDEGSSSRRHVDGNDAGYRYGPESVSGGKRYCIYHTQAFELLKNHYRAWSEAYGNISWLEFLTRLSKMGETGQWVKEVIEVEVKKEG